MPIRTRRPRTGGLAGTAALIAAGALALAGCGDGDTGTRADEPAAAVTPAATATGTATPGDSPTPEASPATGTPAPAPTPTPTPVTLPDLTGGSIAAAVRAAEKADVGYTVVLQGTGQRASSWGSGEKVCEQSGGSGAVTFTVPRDGRDCAGRLLHTPKPTPKPSKTRDGGTGTTSGGTGGTGGGGTGGGSGACELKSPAGNCYADGQFCANKHHGLSTHGRGGEYLTCEQDSAGRWRWSDGVPG
ncbi:hypothetical protein EV562_11030 [Streptomyces sp. BK208]|uniref:hypothetical protein n=1 Tax=Streptomyces sp. BK208 TaxID=2512150 RepID=UPI00105D2888|nr:hypothetical protein [Streptomyces sp. BK208]TDT32177.1 hypothetical protein EV562_11030 [Streptomyces sp. BK208]